MRRTILTLAAILVFTFTYYSKEVRNLYYITNQAPLVAQPYTTPTLGAIRPKNIIKNIGSATQCSFLTDWK